MSLCAENAEEYPQLQLDSQLCFPLYAVSRKIVSFYTPFLKPLGITYTQYLVMMVLWEKKSLNVKELGEQLYLDSGTLTPLLKKMEGKGLVTRTRSKEDERNLIVEITAEGEKMKDLAVDIPMKMAKCSKLDPEESKFLYKILYKILGEGK